MNNNNNNNNNDRLKQKADLAFKNRQFEEAKSLYKDLISLNTDQPDEVYSNFAYCFAIDPDNKEFHLNRKDAIKYKVGYDRLLETNKQALTKLLKQMSEIVADVWKNAGNGWPTFLLAPQSPKIPQGLLDNATLITTRYKMLEYLPKGAKVIEIGTLRGEFAKQIYEVTQPQELHIADITFKNFDYVAMSEILESESVSLHEADSVATMETFPDNYFDWVYIDSDNSYEAGYRDLEVAYRKTKKGGLIIVNGYNSWSPYEFKAYGYFAATNKKAIKEKMQFKYLTLDQGGYHDVALIK